MKIKLLSIAVAAMSLGLSGCSLFEKNVRTEAQLPADRTSVEGTAKSDVYHIQSVERGDIGGDWIIEEVLGKKAKGQDTPYLKFDPATKMVYGSNGCNSVNATYRNNAADSTLSFDGMITTMRLCPDAETSEAVINSAMAATARYTWGLKDGRYSLCLYDSVMQPLMTLSRQDFDFLNGTWRVARIDGQVVNNDEMRLVMDMSEMKIHGNTGCNLLNGSIVTDMAQQGAISFQNMATTRMMCPDINLETSLLVALEAAVKVHPVDENTVELMNIRGEIVLTLVREK